MQSISLNLKQQQQLLINMAMKQAFHVMQLPLLELSEWLKVEIESNPVLEIDHSQDEEEEEKWTPSRIVKRETMPQRELLIPATVSLYEHLMKQVHFIFEERQDLHLAELIIGHLNDKGFLDTPLQEIAPSAPIDALQRILVGIQSCDPPGIGASNLQECLLLQLKKESLAYRIIANHFDDLLHNRLPQIASDLRIPIGSLVDIIEKEISLLDLHPGYRFCTQPTVAIVPDLLLLQIDDAWQIEINTSFLPHFQIAPIYVEALKSQTFEAEETSYLRRQLAGGRWLKRIVERRNQTLRRIGEFLLKKQIAFFNGEKRGLLPLTLHEAAVELDLHESTVARSVANKFFACPHGIFSMKSFFNQGMPGQDISNQAVREMLSQAIEKEDKRRPLSDEQLASHFGKLGVSCARRTIAKYRSNLKIPSACKRKKWI